MTTPYSAEWWANVLLGTLIGTVIGCGIMAFVGPRILDWIEKRGRR